MDARGRQKMNLAEEKTIQLLRCCRCRAADAASSHVVVRIVVELRQCEADSEGRDETNHDAVIMNMRLNGSMSAFLRRRCNHANMRMRRARAPRHADETLKKSS